MRPGPDISSTIQTIVDLSPWSCEPYHRSDNIAVAIPSLETTIGGFQYASHHIVVRNVPQCPKRRKPREPHKQNKPWIKYRRISKMKTSRCPQWNNLVICAHPYETNTQCVSETIGHWCVSSACISFSKECVPLGIVSRHVVLQHLGLLKSMAKTRKRVSEVKQNIRTSHGNMYQDSQSHPAATQPTQLFFSECITNVWQITQIMLYGTTPYTQFNLNELYANHQQFRTINQYPYHTTN